MKYANQNKQYRRGAWAGDGTPSMVSHRRLRRSAKKIAREPRFVSTIKSKSSSPLAKQIRRDERIADRGQYNLGVLAARNAGMKVRIGTPN